MDTLIDLTRIALIIVMFGYTFYKLGYRFGKQDGRFETVLRSRLGIEDENGE